MSEPQRAVYACRHLHYAEVGKACGHDIIPVERISELETKLVEAERRAKEAERERDRYTGYIEAAEQERDLALQASADVVAGRVRPIGDIRRELMQPNALPTPESQVESIQRLLAEKQAENASLLAQVTVLREALRPVGYLLTDEAMKLFDMPGCAVQIYLPIEEAKQVKAALQPSAAEKKEEPSEP